VLVLGMGVVAVTVLSRGDGPAPAQEPAPRPLPREVSARDRAALAALPADTENLVAWLDEPTELLALQRFGRLRRLKVLAAHAGLRGAAAASWKAAANDPDVLSPLSYLPVLEVLELPFEWPLLPEQLKPLRSLPGLRMIALIGAASCGEEMGTAIRALPAVREVSLMATVVEVGLFAELAKLPLRGLALLGCPGLDGGAWAAISRLRTLRRLEVTCQHGGGAAIAGGSGHLGTLGEPAFTAFTALPALRELLLDESTFDDRMMPRLPASLELLDLGDRPMTSLPADTLRRLGGLRDLTFGCGLEAGAAADVIGALRLRRLDYRGRELTPELLRTIGLQAELGELAIRVRSPSIDLSPLATAPRLATLELRPWAIGDSGGIHEGPGLDQLRVLAGSRHLRRLVLANCHLEPTAVHALFGKDVDIDVVEHW
jgi:hypothetical protein